MGPVLLSCIKIFLCRIMDVSLGTFRTMLTVKGRNQLAALVGFCEVFLWYVIVRDALTGDAPVLATAIAYAGGYATGTFVGGMISSKLIKGHVAVHVITSRQDPAMLSAIRQAGYAITVLETMSSEYAGAKYMIIADVDKSLLKEYEALVKSLDKDAFILDIETKNYMGGYVARKK
ncbi:MAG: hypothetical protein II499_09440 [Firmicutes bacterium]|nr:hypothetical protein [Bacillota bacterium]MBQ1887836.1 hypothetical protein [Bacillota bacterium]MBQ2456298.1 hypothetical protein [Bacillota bacterium]MBQ3578157.1 hypothetical protein [Bacillota bacterium]MBQ4235099.1 hypothetical protein [Bacillota bacterium]